MTACRCPACTPKPASTYTEAYRFAAELRHVLALPSRADRISYLHGVQEKRGPEAYERITDELRSIATKRAA